LALLCATALLVGLNARRSKESGRETLASVAKQGTRLAAELDLVEERIVIAERDRDAGRAALAAFRAETAAGPVAAPPEAGTGAMVNPQDALRDNPKLQALMLRSVRASLVQRYGPLIQALGLVPAQIEKFAELTMKRREQMLDLESVAQTRGREDASALTALRNQVESDHAAAQKELLGESGYRQLREFERMAQPRDVVAQLAGAASLNGIALTPTQTDQLCQVIAGASSRYQRGENASVSEVDWTMVDLRAAEILSPEQLTLFKTAEPIGGGLSRWMSQFNRAMDAARKSSQSQPAAKPTGD
jgi:hypothetical protein